MNDKTEPLARIITIVVPPNGDADLQVDPGFHGWEVKGLADELYDLAQEMIDEENGGD